jgi:NAD(P)H-flavin reductase
MIKLSSLIKEVSPDHSNDRDMVVGVAEIIKMVKELDNRKDIMVSMMAKFRNEDVVFDKDEFKKMCQC